MFPAGPGSNVNDLPYTVLTLECWMGSRVQSTVGCLIPRVVFYSVFRGAGACMVAKAIYKQFCFTLGAVLLVLMLACAAAEKKEE